MAKNSKVQPLHPPPTIRPAPEAVRKVFIKDLVASCALGIHRHEKGKKQRVRINLELSVIDTGPPPGDHIRQVVCYEDVADDIRGLLSGPHVHLVETLAEKIAVLCFKDERVTAVRVRVDKLDVFADAESAGVEITRLRSSR
ncbi:MAG: dihydroneopterin aldolase [Alphaproteobacteria bacterium]|nr:dihydroneopterin aldolase [Alphaproteobacteria bacterium]